MTDSNDHLVTHGQLVEELETLGVAAGQIVMVHASVKAIGRIMGGPNVVVQALLDTLTPAGTLMMYVGWENIPDFVSNLSPAVRQEYYAEHPPFDPRIARAVRDHGILAEIVRGWPGARRSLNPEASVAAIGARAEWITQDHPLNYGYGAGSPLEKLVAARGQVLMLGAPLDTLTLLHYAENRARMRNKRVIRYSCPILRMGERVWVEIEDYDTGEPHGDYTFDGIAREYLAQGKGRQGTIGHAPSYLFDAADLSTFAIAWLEERFGETT
nr:AAC3 [uncultured bacterium]AMP48516.1 AAC3 [uncultured bacterium]